eukprot:g6596.t1
MLVLSSDSDCEVLEKPLPRRRLPSEAAILEHIYRPSSTPTLELRRITPKEVKVPEAFVPERPQTAPETLEAVPKAPKAPKAKKPTPKGSSGLQALFRQRREEQEKVPQTLQARLQGQEKVVLTSLHRRMDQVVLHAKLPTRGRQTLTAAQSGRALFSDDQSATESTDAELQVFNLRKNPDLLQQVNAETITGHDVGMLRSASAPPGLGFVPKLSLIGVRSSLQGSALMGLPPPEEPGQREEAPETALDQISRGKFGRHDPQIVQAMLRLLLALALWPCEAKTGIVDALCNTIKVPGVCENRQELNDACQVNPQSCCKESTCAALPGMGCWKQRGDTQCVGDSLPFQVGSCQCISGYCNSDGKCSVTMGFKGQASSGYTAFGRLFEEKDAPILPEDG